MPLISALLFCLLCMASTMFIPLSSGQYWSLKHCAYAVLVELRYKKLQSFLTLKDITFHPNNDQLVYNDNTTTSYISSLQFIANRERLGFTSNLTTKFAGSLFIQTTLSTYKVTIPVGLGILKML